jgi:hypothetical protein
MSFRSLKIQYAYANLFADKDIYNATFKTRMIACQSIFELK